VSGIVVTLESVRDDVETTGLNWRPLVTLILCVIGLGLSGYTLWVHYQPTALVCATAGPIDCQAVLTSAQSSIFGLIPVPFLGLAFFVIIGAFCLPVAWRSEDVRIHLGRLIVAVVGMGMVFYLISTELFTVKKICLWCTGVHIVTFALFVIIVTSTPALLERTSHRRIRSTA
jgi:uncharacterized membrane protein